MVVGDPVARFDLVDHRGNQVSERDFAGSYLLVYFGFTHCKVVCPRSLAKLSAVLDDLDRGGDKIAALYITVDPERDTPEVMRAYLAKSYPRFTGLTGSGEAIERVKKAFRVFAARKADPDDPEGYIVPHSAIAYFMAQDGSYLDHFPDSIEQEAIAMRIFAAIH